MHVFFRSVDVVDEIDQGSRYDVRKMTDRGCHVVVLAARHDKGECAQPGNEVREVADLFDRDIFPGSQNVPGVLDQSVFRVLIAGLFRPGHRMAADEVGRETVLRRIAVDSAFYGSDVGEDRAGLHDGFKPVHEVERRDDRYT